MKTRKYSPASSCSASNSLSLDTARSVTVIMRQASLRRGLAAHSNCTQGPTLCQTSSGARALLRGEPRVGPRQDAAPEVHRLAVAGAAQHRHDLAASPARPAVDDRGVVRVDLPEARRNLGHGDQPASWDVGVLVLPRDRKSTRLNS